MIYEITDKCFFSLKEKQLNKCVSLLLSSLPSPPRSLPLLGFVSRWQSSAASVKWISAGSTTDPNEAMGMLGKLLPSQPSLLSPLQSPGALPKS